MYFFNLWIQITDYVEMKLSWIAGNAWLLFYFKGNYNFVYSLIE